METLKNKGSLNIPDFIWWLGIVEDNNDIAMAGRVKVRIQVIIQVTELLYQ